MLNSKIKIIMGLIVSVFVVWVITWYYFGYAPFTPSVGGFFSDIAVVVFIAMLWGAFGSFGAYDE